jgi:lipopolysaccharide export system protein LptA
VCSLTLPLRPIAALALFLVAPTATRLAAQEECDFLPPTRDFVTTTLSGGETITEIGAPHMRCQDGIEIWADSLVEYSAQGLQHLIGAVRFLDPSGELRADNVRYFPNQGRLQATGHVFVQDTIQGFTIENGYLVYLRATDFREESQMTVTIDADQVRPRAVLQMKPAESTTEDEEPLAPDTTEADSTLTVDPNATDPATREPLEGPEVPGPPAHQESMPPETDEPGSPYIVDGNRIFLQGDSYFRATGDVEIERDSLNAFADSVEYDQVAGRILLEGSARVDGPSYDLVGRTITLGMDGDDIDEIRSVHDAVLTGQELVLTSPEIRIYLLDDLLERLVAVMTPASSGVMSVDSLPARPLAVSDQFELTADSLDVLAPGEQLQRIFAGGTARSVSSARDSLNIEALPEIARTDWLEGDTVIVTFAPADSMSAPASASDTAQTTYVIEQIVARLGARSLYRLPPSDTMAMPGVDAPAVHYVLGDTITIVMVEGEVDRMEVIGQVRGVHVEPVPVQAADSLEADSLAVDTATVSDRAAVADTSTARAPTSAPGPRTPLPHGRPGSREPAALLDSSILDERRRS